MEFGKWPSALACRGEIYNEYSRPLFKTNSRTGEEHKTNAYVKEGIINYMGPQELQLSTIKRRERNMWFGDITRHDTLMRTILQGTMGRQKEKEAAKRNVGIVTSKTGPLDHCNSFESAP